MHQIIIETKREKTFLINIDDVASELKVDHMYIIRYFGSVLVSSIIEDDDVVLCMHSSF